MKHAKLIETGPKSLSEACDSVLKDDMKLVSILLVMNLETLQQMWKTDSKLDDDLHDNDSLAIPQLHMKYMEFHNTYSLMKKERRSR